MGAQRSSPPSYRRLLVCGLLCLLASAATPVHAQGTYSVVVQDIDYYPIYRADPDDGSYSGYVRDLLDAFARNQGIEFRYHIRPIRRMMLEYLKGRYDFAVPDNPNWNREGKAGVKVHYSESLLTFEDAVFVAAGKEDMKPEMMTDYGTINGFTPWKFQERIDSGEIELKVASKPSSLVRMALSGRVEAFNLAVPVAKYHFHRLDVRGRLVPAPKLMADRASHYHLSTLFHPGMIEDFNRFLDENQALVNELQESYGLLPNAFSR